MLSRERRINLLVSEGRFTLFKKVETQKISVTYTSIMIAPPLGAAFQVDGRLA